jgi:cell fate regulator YaaT (PSP1 superfamily)
MIACRAESSALNLPIKIVKAEYSFDGQTLTFLYASDQEERVETNELRQVMSRLYRARIETRQVSPREVAKIIGGMGACGIEQRCCSRFLTEFSPISIKHAKEQGLSLNPHDITGMCGRLRCCLIYEYEQYVEARRHLPKKNAIVGTPAGQGKVVDILPMRDSVVVRVGEDETAKVIVVHREQIVPLEELKRLQEKAASGTCDKHESGQCDCGKGKPADAQPAEASTAQAADAPATAEGVSAEVALGAALAMSGARPSKSHKKRPAGAPGGAGGPQAAGSQAQPPAADAFQRRHKPHTHPPRMHGKPVRQAGEHPTAPAPVAPASDMPASSDAGSPETTGGTAEPHKPRRPLRRPFQRRSTP